MDKDNDFRRYAAEAMARSEASISQADKLSWLRLAQSWMLLVKRPASPSKEEKSFDAAATAQGTGQKRSDESH